MSHLNFFSYPGFGDHVLEHTHYSQAVRIGDRIDCAGQGGWDRITFAIPEDTTKELRQLFDNVEHTLKSAGAEGWKNVFSIRLYHTETLDEGIFGLWVELMKKYCPDHRPILTGIGVRELAFGMKFEVEVSAHVPQEGKK